MKLINTIEEFKKERPDLVEDFEKMNREELLEQIYKESLDAMNMCTRVELLMIRSTIDLSNTGYSLESIETLIKEADERKIAEWLHTASAREDVEYGDVTMEESKEYLLKDALPIIEKYHEDNF